MCYSGQCKYEKYPSGECKGPKDWNQSDALCKLEEEDDNEKEESKRSNDVRTRKSTSTF